MKRTVSRKSLTVLAVLLIAAALPVANAQDQTTTPPSATDTTTLPAGIAAGSQAAQVVKLVQAGVDTSVISAYVTSTSSAFNLDADQIITLKDAGVPSTVINAMMDHDKTLLAGTVSAPAPTPPAPAPDAAPPATDTTAQAPDTTTAPPMADGAADATTDDGTDATPPPPVTIDYFNQTLTPYGSWITVDGYGQCWRPTTVLYDPNWRPYGDRGHWVYTDCGWYWDSDYAWGATFHYGRWFHDPSMGWCWYPDTQWAPSWVTWRSSDDYCGWAPLPPFAVYQPGVGFFYRGASVSVDFDFGLGPDYFTFIPSDHFRDSHPRSFFVHSQLAPEIYHRTTVINSFRVHDRIMVNDGIPVERVAGPNHGPITAVAVGSLGNARREGWRGTVVVPQHGYNPGYNAPRNSGQPQNNPNHNVNYHSQNNFNNNSPGVIHPNNPVLNNGSPNNNHDYHVVSQSPNTPVSSAHYSAPTGPAIHDNMPVNNNGNYYQSRSVTTPAPPAQHSQPQWQNQPNEYQNRTYNNNANVAERPAPEPRTEPTAPVVSQSPERSSGAAYTSHNSGNSGSGQGGSNQGNQSHDKNNNNQQNH